MSLHGKKILLVDDEKDVLAALKSALEHWHGSVEAFSNSKDAFDAFANQPDSFDIVVTDIKMSVMTGFELAAKVRAIRPRIPIIFISGYDVQSAKQELLAGEIKYEDVFRKPFDMAILRDAILSKVEKASDAKST